MIHTWVQVTLAVVSVAVLAALFVVLIRRWCCLRRLERSSDGTNATNLRRSDSFQARLTKLYQLDTSDIKHRGNTNNSYVLRGSAAASTTTGESGGFPSKSGLFSWTDHPSLVTDAVEYGWSRFGFTVHAPPTQLNSGGSARSALLGLCTTPSAEDPEVEITWAVSNGSVDFMQTIRFNHASREIVNTTKMNPLSILRGALPLPGPQLENSAFPQEAYFEITLLEILRRDGDGGGSGDEVASMEGENTKLFRNEGTNLLRSGQWVGEREESVLSLGLAVGGSAAAVAGESGLPGSFAVSIGFHSNGSVYLDGMKLVSESEKHEWAKTNKVVGCGYDPMKKKVYFTINSRLVHVINCKAEEFGTPLYPTIASNIEATLLVNFGQSPFVYAAANTQRTPNPCFIGPVVRPSAATAALEESKELFSIGRIDSQYLSNVFLNRGNNEENLSGRTIIGDSHRRKLDYDEESDADLFEIAIEHSERQNIARS